MKIDNILHASVATACGGVLFFTTVIQTSINFSFGVCIFSLSLLLSISGVYKSTPFDWRLLVLSSVVIYIFLIVYVYARSPQANVAKFNAESSLCTRIVVFAVIIIQLVRYLLKLCGINFYSEHSTFKLIITLIIHAVVTVLLLWSYV